MKVRKAEAVAFGPFAAAALALGPRMNVIYGPNEAGKSSWHAAIYAGICGRRRARGAGTKAEQEFKEDHRPWGGDRWEVKVVLDLADGRSVELYQHLDEPANSRAVDLETGKDITGEFLSDGSPDASRKLGLSRDTMLATATVRQTEIRRVQETSKALQRQLQAATTKAGADETAQAALERIDTFFKESVGRRLANSVRPLQVAINEVQAAKSALADAEVAHEAYRGLRQERDVVEAESATRELELQAARQTFDRLKLDALRDRLARARGLIARLPQGEQPDLEALRQEAKRIGQTVTRFDERPEEVELPEGATAEVLERELAGLPEVPTADVGVSAEVELAREAWRTARDAVRAHEKYRPQAAAEAESVAASGSELRRLAAALEASTPEPDRESAAELEALWARLRTPIWKLGMRATGAALLVAAAGMAAMSMEVPLWVGAAVLGVLALVVGLLPSGDRAGIERAIRGLEAEMAAEEVRRRSAGEERREAESRLAKLGLPLDPDHLRSVARRQDAADSGRKELEHWRAEGDSLAATLTEHEQALTEALTERVEVTENEPVDLAALFARYQGECRERAVQAKEAGRRSGLEAQLRSRQALEQSAAEAKRKRAAAEQEVVGLGEALGITKLEAESVVVELRRRAESSGAEYERWNRAREGKASLEELLGGRKVADLEAEVAAAEVALAEGREALDPVDLGDDPEAAVEASRERLADGRGRLERLEGRIENEEADLVSVAEAQEAVEQAAAELGRVERLERTLDRTRTFLEEARERVQRDIAPHLRGVLEANLAAVTGGRYKEARVDPANLEVTVRATDGEWHSAERLSHGTMEQIYLLLRVALVRHMCSAGESSPIFLDDPTVQSDAERTVAILEVLKELSREHQIILFSQEEEVREWASREGESVAVRLVELEREGGSKP